MGRLLLPVGGWCGPALILGKLGYRTRAFPFDFSRVTLDGVTHFVRNGFKSGFFPPGDRPWRPECVGIWVLFRGQHTAFAHFDLNDDKILDAFRRKMERWDEVLDGNEPVTFVRTVAARDPREELSLIPDFHAAVRERNPQLDFRTVVAVHDQGLAETTQLAPIDEFTKLWTIEYKEDASKTLFDRSQAGYTEIIFDANDDANWPASAAHLEPVTRKTEDGREEVLPVEDLTVERFPWRSHNNIALIDGVASVGGTCVGVGSTRCYDMRCPFCNNKDFHKAHKPFRTNRPFTDEEDELLLVHLYKILTGGDKVEAVEQLAHEMDRGAFEVICRIQFLTNSSTKITESLDFGGDEE